MKRLIKRTARALREEGFLKTCQLGYRWISTRSMILIYEPVQKVYPVAPLSTFDSHLETKIAVQIHMFYMEIIDEIIDYTNHIPYRFDCYISTDTMGKANIIRKRFAETSLAKSVLVDVFPNRGRDIAPFIVQMTPHIHQYEFICHLHTKYSKHDDFGNQWRIELLNSLLASPEHVAALIALFHKDNRLGLIFQRTFWRVKPSLGWKGNRQASEILMDRLNLLATLPNMPQFPAGDMFWAKIDAIAPIFQCQLSLEDFPEEESQLDGTLAHCIERCWAIICQCRGYRFTRVKSTSWTKYGKEKYQCQMK